MSGNADARLLPDDPIIVLGMGGSGTRLVVRLLQEFGVFMGGALLHNRALEPSCFSRGINAFTDGFRYHLPLRSDWPSIVGSHRERILNFCRFELPDLYDQAGYADGPWGFKDPRTTFTGRVMLEAFPSAHIVHVVRHPFDVAASKLEDDWSTLPADRTVDDWLLVWEQVVSVALDYETEGDRYHEIRYEDLSRHRPAAIRSLSEVLRAPRAAVRARIEALAHAGRVGKLDRAAFDAVPVSTTRLASRFGYDLGEAFAAR
jgi:hypothetical protein